MVDSRSKITLFAVGSTSEILLSKEINVNSCNMKMSEPFVREDRPTWRSSPLGAVWRPWVWLALVAVLAWECGGGGGGGSGSTATCTSAQTAIQGLWAGRVTSDVVARGNPGTIIANIFCSLVPTDLTNTGTWKFDFQDPSLDQLFAIVSGSVTESEVSLSAALCNGAAGGCDTVSTCTYDITATLVTPLRMTGSYTATFTCASFNQGTFDITLQNRFTPTVAPTPITTGTPEPTATPAPPPVTVG